MSSSRVHTTFTGAPTAFDVSTASTMKSISARRPKPPPSSVVFTMTFSGGRPVSRAAVAWVPPGFWVGAQITHASRLTWAVAFIGSMHACSRNGTWYTASCTLPPAASTFSASPSFFATWPGCLDAASYSRVIVALDTCAVGPSSHVTLSARRPCRAVQKLSATTATPFDTWTTSLTPLIFLAAVASKLCTLPPNTGQRSIEPTSIPGTCLGLPGGGGGALPPNLDVVTNAAAPAVGLGAGDRVLVERGIGGRLLDLDAVELGVQLIGDDHRRRRQGPLTHLGHRVGDRHDAVAVDPQPLVRREHPRGLADGANREREADREPRADHEAALENLAATDERLHHAPPFLIAAARWMAARMRWYVPQRQMLPDIPSSMSASVGEGLRANSAAADMI